MNLYHTPTWHPLLAPPPEQIPYAYKLDGRLAITAPPAGALAIDEKALTADFVASTEDIDRGGDRMKIAGCDLTRYRLNPVWLLGHAQGMPSNGGLAFPIGTSEAPDGSLKVWSEGTRLIARCHFHAATREAIQAFELVKLGVLRGCSIGFNPITPPIPLSPEPGQLRGGYQFDRWELIELSLVSVPMNPFCTVLRRALDIGKLAGEPISATFRKALEFAAEPSPVWANGWTKEFREEDHPRAEDGKFGSGGGGGGEPSGKDGSEGKAGSRRAAVQTRRQEHASKREAHNAKVEALSRVTLERQPGYSEADKELVASSSRLDDASSGDLSTTESQEAFVAMAAGHVARSAGTFEAQAAGLVADLEKAGADPKKLARMVAAVDRGKAALEKAGAKVTAAAEKLAAAHAERAANPEPAEPETDIDAIIAEKHPGKTSDDFSSEDKEYQAAVKESDKRQEAYDKAYDKWQSAMERIESKIDAAQDRLSESMEALDDAYSDHADRFGEALDAAQESAEESQARESEALDEEEFDIDSEEAEADEKEPDEEELSKQLSRLTALMPAILAKIHTGLQTGTLTMSTKAFPPKEDDNEQGSERPAPAQASGTPPEKPMGGPEGPSLAEAVSALTLAIAQIQEMIKPKEAAPAPAPAAAATNQPGPGNEEWEEEEAGEPEHQGNGKPGQKPTVRDQVREQDEEDSEDSMDALERYRRGGKARKTKAAEPARLKGWAKKEYGECVTMAADHLAELAEMEVGAKWSGSHRTACKTHCEAIRKMCKEMSEADLTEGGATVPEGDPVATEEEKQAVLDGISEAFSSIKDWAYSLTGQKL